MESEQPGAKKLTKEMIAEYHHPQRQFPLLKTFTVGLWDASDDLTYPVPSRRHNRRWIFLISKAGLTLSSC